MVIPIVPRLYEVSMLMKELIDFGPMTETDLRNLVGSLGDEESLSLNAKLKVESSAKNIKQDNREYLLLGGKFYALIFDREHNILHIARADDLS